QNKSCPTWPSTAQWRRVVTSDEFLYHFSEDLEDLGTVRTWPIEDEGRLLGSS
ncbi:hypothetical protein JTE90_027464, partial [Oedothorax gibbosus]